MQLDCDHAYMEVSRIKKRHKTCVLEVTQYYCRLIVFEGTGARDCIMDARTEDTETEKRLQRHVITKRSKAICGKLAMFPDSARK